MRKLTTLFLILLFSWPIILRAGEVSLTLNEAVALAMRENRDILLKSEEVNKAKAKISEANASMFPSLNLTGSWSDTRGYFNKDLTQSGTQATLKQYLYKGGKVINTIKYNQYGLKVSQAILDKVRLETVLNVEKAYYTFLLAAEFAKLNEQILENAKEHLCFLEARYKNGQVCESDILAIKESLASVEQAYRASLSQIEAGQALLKNLLYLADSVQIKATGTLQSEPREVAYDEAFLNAMARRPEIRQYEAAEQANKKAIEIAKADNRPNIYASWDYYSRSHTVVSTLNSKNWNDYNIIGLTFSWPIFDGWQTKAKVEQAVVELKESQILKEKAVKDIALELKQAYLDLKDAIGKMSSTQAQVDLYKNTLSVTQEKYKAGIASLLDLKDVSLGYQVAMFNQKQAVYDYLLAKARFEKAAGGA